MECQVSSELKISEDTALVLDFAVALGREVMICGGEMWRVEQVLNDIFKAYHLIETSIYMDIHSLIISGRREGESHVIRQIQVGDIASEMERLTRLTRLTGKVCSQPPAPCRLKAMLDQAIGAPTYDNRTQMIAIVCALVSFTYILGGNWRDALMAGVGIIVFRLCNQFFADVPGTNPTVLHATVAFVVGCGVSFVTFRLGFQESPYMAVIVMAFGLIPGLPLINACREIFCGRVLCSVQLFLQSFVETAIVVSGFVAAINWIGG